MTANEKFKNWMDSIPYGMYNDVRKRVIKECKIPSSTYSNWRNGSCTIPLLAQEKIEALSEKISEEIKTQNIKYKILFSESKTS